MNACPKCNSTYLVETILSGSVHHGKLTCGNCERFIKWLPKPAKVPEISIIKLLHSTALESWERKFLKTIVYRSNLTKGEMVVLETISAKINPVPSGRGTG